MTDPTQSQPLSQTAITPNTIFQLPLGLLVTIFVSLIAGLGGLIGGVVKYNTLQIQVEQNVHAIEELKHAATEHEEKDRQAELHFQKVDTAIERLSDINIKLEAYNAKLEVYTNRVNILLYRNKLLQADGSFR
jgi:hypothetical protein